VRAASRRAARAHIPACAASSSAAAQRSPKRSDASTAAAAPPPHSSASAASQQAHHPRPAAGGAHSGNRLRTSYRSMVTHRSPDQPCSSASSATHPPPSPLPLSPLSCSVQGMPRAQSCSSSSGGASPRRRLPPRADLRLDSGALRAAYASPSRRTSLGAPAPICGSMPAEETGKQRSLARSRRALTYGGGGGGGPRHAVAAAGGLRCADATSPLCERATAPHLTQHLRSRRGHAAAAPQRTVRVAAAAAHAKSPLPRATSACLPPRR
jgi:hypothetical protein